MRHALSILLVVATSGCKRGGDDDDDLSADAAVERDGGDDRDAAASDDAGPDSGDDAGLPEAPAPDGNRIVDACAGLNGIDETCGWRWRFDEQQCAPATPCARLVAFFAGGEQDCSGYDGILDAFAVRGYVAACITIFETSDASGAVPYVEEAERVDTVLADYVGSDVARAVWTGEDLLVAGVSHGATAPVIAMARTDVDDGPHWHGSRTTGACFYDGIYDIAAFDELLGTGAAGGRPCEAPVSHARVVGRYYDHDPAEHSCTNDQCACDPDHAPAMDVDTITDVLPRELSIESWKLIECGSQLGACLGDIVPGPPIETLCSRIDSGPTHTCTFDSMPTDSHITCAGVGVDRCADWFEAL